jgi:hypothetical protein
MVTTRSGKPVLAGFKVGASQTKVGAIKQTVFIFEDADVVPSGEVAKKRESPCKVSHTGVKKSKADSSVVDKENSTNVIPPSAVGYSEVKKIQISEDEKLMNGAPEGDLFEMVVFEDGELWPFASDAEAVNEVGSSCKKHSESTVWADKYEAVVVMRRVLLHHTEVISRSMCHLTSVVAAAVADADSLRSCRVRNGIMCLRTLLTQCSSSLSNTGVITASSSSACHAAVNHINSIVNSLLAKTGGGPKFILELSLNTLLNAAVPNLEPTALISCLFTSVEHRNADLAANAILAAVGAVRRIDTSVLCSAAEVHMLSLRDTFCCLALALNAKRHKAKEEAKLAIKYVHAAVGDDHFQALVALHLSEVQAKEVSRVLCTSAPSVPSTPSQQVPSTPQSAASASSVRALPPGSGTMRMPASSQASHAMSVAGVSRPGASRLPPSGQTSGVSKFRLHMQATASAACGAKQGEADDACAAPARSLTPAPGPLNSALGDSIAMRDVRCDTPSSSSTALPVVPAAGLTATPAAPALSLRDHINLMKQQKRQIAQQAQTPQPGLAMSVEKSSREVGADTIDVVGSGAMDVSFTPKVQVLREEEMGASGGPK